MVTASFADAQDAAKVNRIGWINTGPAAPNQANVEAFRGGLRELGYIEGRKIIIDYRRAEQKIARLPA